MKKLSLLLIFILCSTQLSFAQNKKIDILLSLLKTDKEDTNKVNHLNLLSEIYLDLGSYDSAIVFANQALIICNSPFEGGKGDVLTNKQMAQLTLVMTKCKAAAYINLASIKRNQGNYPKALDFYLKALKLDEELKDKERITKGYWGI